MRGELSLVSNAYIKSEDHETERGADRCLAYRPSGWERNGKQDIRTGRKGKYLKERNMDKDSSSYPMGIFGVYQEQDKMCSNPGSPMLNHVRSQKFLRICRAGMSKPQS